MRRMMAAQSGSFFGFTLACVLFGCASFNFPYKFYKPISLDWNGSLLGANPSDDLPYSLCTNGKCVTMFTDDFFKMKTEYLDMASKLNKCERAHDAQ